MVKSSPNQVASSCHHYTIYPTQSRPSPRRTPWRRLSSLTTVSVTVALHKPTLWIYAAYTSLHRQTAMNNYELMGKRINAARHRAQRGNQWGGQAKAMGIDAHTKAERIAGEPDVAQASTSTNDLDHCLQNSPSIQSPE